MTVQARRSSELTGSAPAASSCSICPQPIAAGLLEPVIVGPVPASFEARRRGIQVLPTMARSEYLALLSRAQVIFSPTDYSFGVALLEAAAAGAAIVTSCGRGMEHITELFERDRHARLIPNEWPASDRLDAYVRALTDLVVDGDQREAMSQANRRLAETGPFSIERRDRKLLGIYGAALGPCRSDAGDVSTELVRAHGLTSKELGEEYLWLELAARTQRTAVRLLF